jgi:hypothetical protein
MHASNYYLVKKIKASSYFLDAASYTISHTQKPLLLSATYNRPN